MTATVRPRPHLGDPVAWSFPKFTRTRVAPGIVVHHLHVPGRGLVAADLLLDAPVTAEPAGHEGLALITARGLDEGSSQRDGDAFAVALDRLGAHLGASANTAGMRVSLDVPSDTFADALALLAEAAADAVFPEREVARLVRQRRDSIRQQLARPEDRASIVLRDVVVDGHRCRLPNGGTDDTVATIDRDLAAGFHADHALTGPVSLVVAGDLTGLDLPELAATRLAPWADASRDPHPAQPLPVRSGPRVVVVDMPGAVQSQLVIARRGPDRHAGDWSSARVAGHVLGGTLTSRLDSVLREDKGYTYGIRTRLGTFRRGGIVRLASGSVDTEHTAESVELALGIIERLATEGATEAERDDAVEYLVGVRPLALETPRALVSEVGRNLGDGLAADHTRDELDAMRRVTTDEVSAAAACHLRGSDATVVVVGDADAITADLEALGHGPTHVRT